jgi:hypothetical protein
VFAASYDSGVRLLAAIKKSEPAPASAEAASELAMTAREPTAATSTTMKLDCADVPQLGAQPLFLRHFYLPCINGAMSNLDPECTAVLRRFIVMGNGGRECLLLAAVSSRRCGIKGNRTTARLWGVSTS